MVAVPWGELAQNRPRISEALVIMLILRLREQAQAVDGDGGDGGRDAFEFTQDGELVLYEAKSFTGRMTHGRRNQVVRSLISAARHQPDYWDLLVPIDPNPAELRWFEGLRSTFPFVRNWRGLCWLDQQMSAHSDLVRYALQESGDYILERIAEARAERDTLQGGMPDVAERMAALNARAQEISPHYAVSTSVDVDGRSTVRLTPRSSNIPAQAAITFTSEFRFRTSDPVDEQRRAQFEEAMRFGGEVDLYAQNLGVTTMVAPDGLGLSRSFTPDHMRITSPREDIDPPLLAQLAVEQPSGLPAASLPVRFTARVTGTDGATLDGADLAGFLRVRIRVDQRNRSCRMTLSFAPPQCALPNVAVPVLRLIQHVRPGRVLALALAGASGGNIRAMIPEGMIPANWGPSEAQEWADAYEDLATLQSRVGLFFPVPEDFSSHDAQEVKNVLALLDGEQVQFSGDTASINVTSAESLELVAAATASRGGRFVAQSQSLVFSIGGQEIPLGPCVEVVAIDGLLNLVQARQALAENGSATVHMRINKTVPVVRYLGTLPEPGLDQDPWLPR